MSASNTGLAGQSNTLPGAAPPNALFLGGYGTVLDQLFSRKFPNYSASFALTVPIRNRSAQADL